MDSRVITWSTKIILALGVLFSVMLILQPVRLGKEPAERICRNESSKTKFAKHLLGVSEAAPAGTLWSVYTSALYQLPLDASEQQISMARDKHSEQYTRLYYNLADDAPSSVLLSAIRRNYEFANLLRGLHGWFPIPGADHGTECQKKWLFKEAVVILGSPEGYSEEDVLRIGEIIQSAAYKDLEEYERNPIVLNGEHICRAHNPYYHSLPKIVSTD